jgi:regulator of PEP synthase PpsR (kinase-PPPase family)
MVRAAMVHFGHLETHVVRCKNIRTQGQLEQLIEEAQVRQGMMIHTFASHKLRKFMAEGCGDKGVPAVDLLGPLLEEMAKYLGVDSKTKEVGKLRAVNERYFKRIEAIEYTVKHDDGKLLNDLNKADIVLVGISRTSKTPLSIFLSHKGWKVANIPLVINTPLPNELFQIDQRKVVGLVIDPEALYRIRRKRLEKFGQDPGGEYASMKHIGKEIEYAMDLFKQNRRWPVFDVTDRALEETASEIVKIVASRMNLTFDALL